MSFKSNEYSNALKRHCERTEYLRPEFLDQYGPHQGDCVVILVESDRKVWYWLHKRDGWELAFLPRSYRKNRGEYIRPGSYPIKICKDGTVLAGYKDVPELTMVKNDGDIQKIRNSQAQH